ncbi:hypothetical protein SAMN02745866_01377 [Alteromonadaceae bacterium Bs31]|nr:hypothetical protein SAMN02745866_01377 [Alteromonadaceae bacterium Bs31]
MCVFKYFLAFMAVAALVACGGGGGSDGGADTNNTSSSSSGSSSSGSSGSAAGSHNAGTDCMNSGCHNVGGAGVTFASAGTVYRSNGAAQSNAEVRLYVFNTNTLLVRMQTDASGNFYTTQAIDELYVEGGDFVTGTNVELEGPGGGIHTMPGKVTNGSCNGCHGQSNGRLTAN